MAQPIIWFAALHFLGLLAFPFAFHLFRRLPGRGYGLAIPLALILAGYSWWLIGHIPGSANFPGTILLPLVFAAALSGWLARGTWSAIREYLRLEWPTILVTELVFLVFFALWLAVAAHAPAINHTEKPMDFGFLNAVLYSNSFPPEDPWLAGHSISYYYFGHLMMAFLVKLTGVASPIGYNLAIATIPALLAAGTFTLVSALVRLCSGSRTHGCIFGAAAPVLLILIGNLEGGLELIHSLGWGSEGFWQWVGIKGLEGGPGRVSSFFPDQYWWWWRATRVIDTLSNGVSLDYTITEFPSFSFLLGDLHPHMTGLPFVVLFLTATLNLYLSDTPAGLPWLRRHPLEAAALALFLGALAFTNTWDFPVFAVILGGVVFAKSLRDSPSNNPVLSSLVRSFIITIPIAILGFALFLPFYLTFTSQAGAPLPVTGPGTRPFLFLVVMGFPVLLAAAFSLRQVPSAFTAGTEYNRASDGPLTFLAAAVAVAPLILWAIGLGLVYWIGGPDRTGNLGVVNRLTITVPLLLLAGLAGLSALRRNRLGLSLPVGFPLLLSAAAFGLLALAELFYVLDFFGNRMNTVFKVYYQSWLLLTVAGSVGLYYLWVNRRTSSIPTTTAKYALATLGIVLLAISLYYPVGAIMDRTGIGGPGYTLSGKTLDGLAFAQERDPGEYRAIRWLRETAPPGRLVEAVGSDYTDYGRVSSSTGRPTILGWPGHEHQWRGSLEPLAGREEDVRSIYTAGDIEQVARLLDKYEILYVYVGRRERETYGPAGLTRFEDFMETVFTADGLTIYALPDGSIGSAPDRGITGLHARR